MPARDLDAADPGVRRAWAALVDVAEPSPFAPLDAAEATAAAFGLRLRLLGVEQDGALAGGVAAYEKRRGPVRLAVVPPLTPTTPVVLAAPPTEAEVHARATPLGALAAGLAERFHLAALQLQPSLADVRPFTWAGWSAQPRYTYAGPLGPLGEMAGRASKAVRKRDRRDGGGFSFSEEPDAVGVLQALEAEAFARQGTAPPVDTGRQAALFRALARAGRARLFVLRDAGGEPTAAQAVTWDGRAAAFVSGASRPGSAMTVMTLRVFDRLYQDGARWVDLGGANLPPVAEFKRAFGLPLVPSLRVRRVGPRALRALDALR